MSGSSGLRRMHLRISGLVQGVSFRWHTRRIAQALGLVGWVKNLPDGSVEVLAEGEEGALRDLLAWCRRGPELAQVERVEERFSDATGGFSEFRVTR
ncbi:MAG: acylphosphatase [Myxococcales bacterium]|nr:acylphosphatase [Myxococcales bacterium]